MYKICFVLLALIAKDCSSQNKSTPYLGKLIGSLSSYHHQVSGDVYAVDDWTLLLVDFNYDGTGDDTFFWTGDAAGRPGPQGFIVPDEHGKTNVLEKYYNAELRLQLPEGKRVSRLKWFSIYDVATQNSFADVFVPDEFESPSPRRLPPLRPAPGAAITSGPIMLLDAATLQLTEFKFEPPGEAYFFAGLGPQPSSRGFIVPDERGYLEPLGAYKGEDVTLRLSGGRSVFDIDWLCIWDAKSKRPLGTIIMPEQPNVPPGLARALPPSGPPLPRCRRLHRDLQMQWEVFGPQISIRLVGKISPDEYMAVGMSGSVDEARMVGADVAVASYDASLQQGLATDYNVTEATPCVVVLGAWRGVCRDDAVGGLDSNQVISASHADGLTSVTWRRVMAAAEPTDRDWPVDKLASIVWAVGALDASREPSYHRLSPRRPLILNLTAAEDRSDDCEPFTAASEAAPKPWEVAQLVDPALRVFEFRLGPSGGPRGVASRGASAALAWYVNGQLAPDLQLRRGLRYSFRCFGGRDPHRAALYHPLVVTAEPRGGLERLPEPAQRAVNVLAGVTVTRRRLSPSAAGPLCLATPLPLASARQAADFATFRAYNRSLSWRCEPGPAAVLAIAPNTSWPDLVYYHSFTHPDISGRIYIVDKHRRPSPRAQVSAAPAPKLTLTGLALLTLTAAATLTLLH